MAMLLAAGAGLGGRIGFFTDFIVLAFSTLAAAAEAVAMLCAWLWI